MGLRAFVMRPDVRAKLRALRPNCPRKIRGLYKLAPWTNHRLLVDVAFNYLLGFEIKRLAPHAEFGVYGPRRKITQLRRNPVRLPESIIEQMEQELQKLEADLSDYTLKRTIGEEDRKHVADLALKLAKFELRAVFEQQSDVLSYKSDPRDVADLLAMLEVAPVESFASASRILLWPPLLHASPYVRSADIDFIVGDRIVKVTTVNSMTISNYVLDELLGQLFLAWKEHEFDAEFPLVTRASFYSARHGYTLTLNSEDLMKHGGFDELYDWFFETAAQVYHYSPPDKGQSDSPQKQESRRSWWDWISSWLRKKN